MKAILEERDELADFWALPRASSGTDPVQHWVGVLVGQPESRLARMAIDYLSIPATSVDVEHAFSHGALTVTHHRHALSDKSTHNSIVVGGWLKDTSLIPKEELIDFFGAKSSHGEVMASENSTEEISLDPNSPNSDNSDSDSESAPWLYTSLHHTCVHI